MMAFAPPKSTDAPKMQTKMSTWTPLNHQLLNDRVSDQNYFISVRLVCEEFPEKDFLARIAVTE